MLGFGASYIRDLTVYIYIYIFSPGTTTYKDYHCCLTCSISILAWDYYIQPGFSLRSSAWGGRHQMENIFRVTDHLFGEFPAQRPVTRSFDVFYDLRPNKQLNKQPWGWWFETPSRPLWRHSNGYRTAWRNMVTTLYARQCVNTLSPRQNGRRFPDNIFKCVFLNEK